MEKPEGYEEFSGKVSAEWMGGPKPTTHHVSRWDSSWNTPKCVPKLHRGVRAGVEHIFHKMTFPCDCKENSDKPAHCRLKTTGGQTWYGVHLPGECPGIRYRPRG
jgi:hypothetical protein